MRIVVKFSGNAYNLMRQLGYHPHESSFVRRFSAADYPRFHIYFKRASPGEIDLTLHLDQKKPIYKGTTAHSGEYDGELVEREAERIKQEAMGL